MRRQLNFSEGLLKIYDAAYSKNGWTEAMEFCRRAAAAKHTLVYAYGLNDEIKFSVEGGSPTLQPFSAVISGYNKRFRDSGVTGYDDVGSDFMKNTPVGVAVKDTDIWPLQWLKKREEVKYLSLKLEVFRRFYLNVSHDPLVNSGIIFYYGRDLIKLPIKNIETAASFGPHLAKAFDISRWADNIRKKYQVVLGALNKIDLGVCVTDEMGRVILTNTHAVDIFSDKDGLWCDRNGAFATSDPDTARTLKAAVRSIIQTSAGNGKTTAIEHSIKRRGSDNPLLVIVSPLRDADMELEKGLSGCLITIVDTDRSKDLRLDAFGDAYGFTATEKRSAALLVSGLTTPEIGEELGVAKSTAATHVKSLMQKTRTKTRVNFVWRALQFTPPVL